MSQPTPEEVFKTIATRIVGQWHCFDETISLTFYTIPKIDEAGIAFIARGNQSSTTTYRIDVIDHAAVKLIIEGDFKPMDAVIKVLTTDSLILQDKRGIEILQRMPDMDFADKVIRSL